MLRAAFPNGVAEADYLPLLAVLYEGMSFRGVANVMAKFTGRPYASVYNDVLGAASDQGPTEDAKGSVRDILRKHGFDAWVAKED